MIQPDKPTADRFLEKNFLTAHVEGSTGLEGSTRIEGAHGLGINPKPPGYGPDYPREGEAKRRDKIRVPSLLPILYRKAGGARTVVVTEGRVGEVIPRKADANDDGFIEHAVTNIWDGTLLREHAIQTNEIVGIEFTVDKNGYIDSACTVDVRTEAAAVTTHFQPEVGESVGAAGTCFYGLAQLTGSGDSERLVLWEGGAPPTHYHDTPPFKRAEEGTGLHILKQYNLVRGLYEYFGITAESPVNVAMDGDDIKWKLTGVRDLDLIVKSRVLVNDGPVDTPVPITIYGVSLTGTTDLAPNHSHDLDGLTAESSGSEHYHNLTDHYHRDGSNLPTTDGVISEETSDGFVRTGLAPPALPLNDYTDDGAHEHTIGGTSGGTGDGGAHDHTVTVTGNITTTATIKLPTLSYFKTMDAYYTLCWRAGVYVGVFDSAVPLPAPSGNGLDSKTIYVLNGEYSQLDFSQASNSQLIPPIT